MSAAVKTLPRPATKLGQGPANKALHAANEAFVLEDGSLVIPPEKLKRFGNGDAARGRQELRLLIEAENDREVHLGPAVKPASVRIAMPADEPAIMELLLADVRENAERIAVVDPERILSHLKLCTEQKGGICGVIDGPNGKPVAVCLLVPQQWWWSREWFIQEMVNFVHPDHRRSRHIHDLIAFERWVADAQSTGFGHRVYILMGVLGLNRVREKAILYRRKMRQVGWAFMYPCPYGDDARMT